MEDFEYYSLSPETQWQHPMIIEIPTKSSELGLDGLPLAFEGPTEIVKVYDLMPPELTHPSTPVFFAPGWTGTAEGLKPIMTGLTEYGWRTLSVSAKHGITPTEDFPGAPLAEVRKMNALLMAIERKDVDKPITIVAHSEGAIFSVLAAANHPEKFHDLILVAPAGLLGKDSWFRLITGFGLDAIEQLAAGVKDKVLMGQVMDSIRHVGWALVGEVNREMTMAELQAIITFHIERLLVTVRKSGHRVIIIHGVDDREFPMNKMQRNMHGMMVDGFLSVRGHHHEMFIHPEQYARVLDQLLTTLEKNKT